MPHIENEIAEQAKELALMSLANRGVHIYSIELAGVLEILRWLTRDEIELRQSQKSRPRPEGKEDNQH